MSMHARRWLCFFLLVSFSIALPSCSDADDDPVPSANPSIAQPLTVGTSPTRRPAAPSFANFRPSSHGFRFRNQFTGSPLPFSLGGLEKYVSLPNHYGLCGGMSFAAADYFLAGIDPPVIATPPAKGQELYKYLYQRQVDSLGDTLVAVPKFARWMDLPDDTPFGTGARTCAELGDIVARLEAGEACHLGLVFVRMRDGGKLWENHQVLAYGVEFAPGDGLFIRIYDPNYPVNDRVFLHVSWRPAGMMVVGTVGTRLICVPYPGAEVVRRTSTPGRRDQPVRGFFQMNYSRRQPPRL